MDVSNTTLGDVFLIVIGLAVIVMAANTIATKLVLPGFSLWEFLHDLNNRLDTLCERLSRVEEQVIPGNGKKLHQHIEDTDNRVEDLTESFHAHLLESDADARAMYEHLGIERDANATQLSERAVRLLERQGPGARHTDPSHHPQAGQPGGDGSQ